MYKRMDKRKTVVQFTGAYINSHKNDTLSVLDRHFGQECRYIFSYGHYFSGLETFLRICQKIGDNI